MSALLIEDELMAAQRLHRVNLNIDEELYDYVRRQRLKDHVSTSDRVRALLVLAQEDPDLQARVVAKATELAEARVND